MRKFFLLFLIWFTWIGNSFGQELKILHLKCGYSINPVGIADRSPALSWELQSARRGTIQAGYRIQVSTDSVALARGLGASWDSKKILSDASIQIRYAGEQLKPATIYYWRIMAWGNHGDSSRWSAIAKWQTGLYSPTDWKGAKWIGYEEIPDSARVLPDEPGKRDRKDGPPHRDILPLLRKEFAVGKPIKKATAFVSGLGQFEMMLNGMRVGDHFLDPGWTNYQQSAQYVVFDITRMLKTGMNAVGMMLGNGFYYIPRERYHKLIVAYGYPKMITRIKLEFADGTISDIVSDASWATAPGPITYSSIYGGEDYDARMLPGGWDLPGFRGDGWRAAMTVDGPPVLTPQLQPPLKIMQYFQPRRIIRKDLDTTVYDLGQNASGIPGIRVRGKRGQTIRIIPGEQVNADGTIPQDATGKPYCLEYTLKGSGEESWQPRFTYYGFRYLRVEGKPEIISIRGCHTRNSAERVGKFSCSNELFRRTDTLIDWALRSNMSSVLTDCPHREKLGWLEQVHLMASALRYNYDIVNLFRKAVHDMMDAQTKDGLVPEISPEFTQFYEPFRDSPEWASSSILLPWYLYQYYGDMQTLSESYPMMRRYIGYLSGKTQGHLLYQGLGDWYDLGPKEPGVSQLTPKGLTASAIYYYDLTVMMGIAKLLGKEEDAMQYADSAAVVRRAFNEVFYHADTRQYGSGSQAANAIAVYMGLVDFSDKAAVVENIVKDVRVHGNALTAGDIGYRYLLKVLDDEGRSDVIFDMNNRSDVPGYGYQLSKGATALTESWQAYPYVSNNHFMLGHIMEWFYAGLAGIRSRDSVPAFRDIVLKPALVGDVRWAKGEYESPYGQIVSAWQLDGRAFSWDIGIPGNTWAEIWLPAAAGGGLTESGKTLDMHKDIRILGTKEGFTLLRIGSGKYHFHVEPVSSPSRSASF